MTDKRLTRENLDLLDKIYDDAKAVLVKGLTEFCEKNGIREEDWDISQYEQNPANSRKYLSLTYDNEETDCFGFRISDPPYSLFYEIYGSDPQHLSELLKVLIDILAKTDPDRLPF